MKISLKRRYNMEQILRIYSIAILVYFLVSSLHLTIKTENKVDRAVALIVCIMLVPIFYYIIKF